MNDTLYNAILADDLATVCSELNRGADPNNYCGPDDDLPLSLACSCRDPQFLQTLLNAGASPTALDRKGRTPWEEAVFEACNGDDTPLKEMLRVGCPVDIKLSDGTTALFHAVWWNVDLVQLLLKADANPNAQDNSGCTPLMYAVTPSHCNDADVQAIEKMQMLIVAGTNLSLRNNDGKNARDLAAMEYDWGLSEALVKLLDQQLNQSL